MSPTTGATPRLGITIDYSADFHEVATEVVEAERLGVDLVSVAEAYSFDGVSRLGYLAAVTSTIGLASGIMPLYSRSPTLIGMTAAGLDDLSGGRYELGLGTSGPQVIEGFHGVPFRMPLASIRQTVEICRALWRREAIVSAGPHPVPLPPELGTGLGKPLKLINHPVRSRIPIALASLAPKAVAQAAEIAEAWIPLFYWPERAHLAWGDALASGLALRDAELPPLDVQIEVPLLISDDTDAALERHRAQIALYVGGMGARGKNFYNDLAVRYGLADAAAEVQDLYLAGEKARAAEALPAELVESTALIGNESHVRSRVEAIVAAGGTTILTTGLASTAGERLEQLSALRGMLDAL